MSEPVIAKCHCGAVAITLAQAPETIVDCNCSLCTAYGVLWTYYEVGEISDLGAAGATHTYAWNGKNVDFHRCAHCGCVTHWIPRSATRTRRGINARLLPQAVRAAARVRKRNGAGNGEYLD